MPSATRERETAIAAADATCPRCGASREPDHRYCLDCGLALPGLAGPIPRLRRRWLRRLGWYPGDWVWISLPTLLLAVLGAAAAIAVSEHRESARGNVFTAPVDSIAVTEPTVVPTTRAPTGDTSTLPTAPEPRSRGAAAGGSRNGRLHWPANENGWTIVLVSYPRTNGRPAALATAARGAKAGLRQVGILDSGRFASLQPGYYVVFSGIYSSKADADAGVGTARGAGFGGAYSRQIAR
jgi:hypothetical protein